MQSRTKHIMFSKRPKAILLVLLFVFLWTSCTSKAKKEFTLEDAQKQMTQAWDSTYPQILESIHPPKFLDTTLTISYTDDFRNRLNHHIDSLSHAGGGTIAIDSGSYLSKGSIFLKSNIRLHFKEGVELLFSTEPEDYLPMVKSRWEGTFLMNYSPLIYALDAENIAITGKGSINGQAEQFWYDWKKKQKADKKQLRKMGNDQIPLEERIFGEGHYLRPSAIEFIDCKNILLEGFSIKGSPFWTIHPVLSKNITVRGLNIQAGTTNDDGIDPESCRNVLIEGCSIQTHDDCIAIKAGRDQDGWDYPPSENFIIRNNMFNTEVGSGFCIGSEMSAGVRNIFVENCTLKHSGKHAFQFKSNPDRGGFIRDVFIRNIEVGTTQIGFEFTTDYKGWRGNEHFTAYRDFYFQNITIDTTVQKSIVLQGRTEKPIQDIYFQDCTIDFAPEMEVVEEAKNVLFVNTKINGQSLPTKS
ncbi:MAG: glycoside hydrolase family 28 protein [Bacteroidota bacterium]